MLLLLFFLCTLIHAGDNAPLIVEGSAQSSSFYSPQFIACARQREQIRIDYLKQTEEAQSTLLCFPFYSALKKRMDKVTPESLRPDFEARETYTQRHSLCIEQTAIGSRIACGGLALCYPLWSMPCAVCIFSRFELESYPFALLSTSIVGVTAENIARGNCARSQLEDIPAEFLNNTKEKIP